MRRRAALSGSIAFATFTTLLVAVSASCGSGVAPTSGEGGEGGFVLGGGDDGGGGADGSRDSSITPLADAPFACGTSTCRVDQYCLQPCCGGPAPACLPASDAGTCPAGSHLGSCPGSGQQGCVEDPCKPPPPSCIDDPKASGAGCEQQGSSRNLVCLCA